MKYFKNTELAKLYNVSEKSVRNWIEAAQAGKVDLQLFEENGKSYVANTTQNNQLIENLVQKGRKFKNTRGFKILRPSKEFYDTYNEKQILDIVSSLTIHKEIPVHYGYLDGGAESWDKYANRLQSEKTPNILNRTTGLLDLNSAYFGQLVADHDKINVIDLGPGNGLPLRRTLERLLKTGKLNRYIAIDISQDMLTILERNIKSWFGDKINLECHVRNFTEERFDDLLTADFGSTVAPVNMVFLLGGTLSNVRYPDHTLRVINSSLKPDDLFFVTGYLDTPYTQRYFDLSGASYNQKDPQQSGLIPSLFGIDETICEFEQLFSPERRSRFKRMTPKVDLLIKLEVDGRDWSVELRKDEPILLWRHRHYNVYNLVGLFMDNDFELMQVTKSSDQNYVLVVSKIKTGIDA